MNNTKNKNWLFSGSKAFGGDFVLFSVCVFSLMQQWSDNRASFGVRLKHQSVQVWQEGVTDVEDISRRSSKGVIPGHRILSLTENETHN